MTTDVPYLPTEPIIPFLRRKVDENVLRQGRPASGIESICFELSRITGHAMRSCERQIVRILRGHVTHVWDTTADALANAIGYGPEAIWTNWYELTDVPSSTRDVRVTWDAMPARMELSAKFERDGKLVRAVCIQIPGVTAVAADRVQAKAALLLALDAYMRKPLRKSRRCGDVEQLAVVIPRIPVAS